MDGKVQVRCHVDTCNYHKNNFCNASVIEVNPQGTSKSKNSDQTQCTTFEPGK